MEELSTANSKKCSIPNVWMLGLVIIFIVWCAFLSLQCFCKDFKTEILVLDIIPHVFFLALFVISAVISYKSFKIQSEMQEKENEFRRKKEWETSQSDNYAKIHAQQSGIVDLEAKVKEIVESIMKRQEQQYKDNLKTLAANMQLFNDVKKIVETSTDKETTEPSNTSEP
jgi:hypothetical protein